jgi:hypothetical protein
MGSWSELRQRRALRPVLPPLLGFLIAKEAGGGVGGLNQTLNSLSKTRMNRTGFIFSHWQSCRDKWTSSARIWQRSALGYC